MKRMIAFIGSIMVSLTLLNCTKNKSQDESIFYGTWTKGTNAGDTLIFYQKNGKNMLAYNLSFNPAFYAPAEVEYFYINGHLSTRPLNYPDADFPVKSLSWKQVGQKFEVQGMELFPFMSSTQVYFTYRKIR